MTRLRAADDFEAIRARMEELQRERVRMSAREEPATLEGSPRSPVGRVGSHKEPRLLSQILRAIARADTT